MKTIWKYELDCTGAKQHIEMPIGAIIRHVDMQEDLLCLWAEVDTQEPLEMRSFVIVGTGHAIPLPELSLGYIGTVLNPPFVWHIYEIIL